jgi:uncharacterized membrane protein YbhN (UPF0104 family)
VLFSLVVIGLLTWAASKVEWAQVGAALQRIPPASLLAALGVGALSHAVYSTYDLMGRAWTGHRLPWQKVVQTTFVSYAFNLNLGSLVGGFAFRFRLYSRMGLGKADITKILALSLTTNWLGYATLAGGVFMMQWLTPPEDWAVSLQALQWLGGALWLVVAAYIGVCAFAKQRSFSVRGHDINLPPGRVAVLQVVISSVNWLMIAGVLWLLLGDALPYPRVLGALLAAAIAGVLTHVPAGIGVLEAVFLALLTPAIPTSTLLAALLAYRAVYYILPLVLATGLYFMLEAKADAAQEPHPTNG